MGSSFLWENYCVLPAFGELPSRDNPPLWQAECSGERQIPPFSQKQINNWTLRSKTACEESQGEQRRREQWASNTNVMEWGISKKAETHEGLIHSFSEGDKLSLTWYLWSTGLAVGMCTEGKLSTKKIVERLWYYSHWKWQILNKITMLLWSLFCSVGLSQN